MFFILELTGPLVRIKQLAAVAISVAIVFAAYLAWTTATGRFNPSPNTVSINTTSCFTSTPPCPAFRIDSSNLTVRELQDIVSQELVIKVTALGPTQIDRLSLFFNGYPIGNLTEKVLPGESALAGWAIPTTLNISQGSVYGITVGSEYPVTGTQEMPVAYWVSTSVEAH